MGESERTRNIRVNQEGTSGTRGRPTFVRRVSREVWSAFVQRVCQRTHDHRPPVQDRSGRWRRASCGAAQRRRVGVPTPRRRPSVMLRKPFVGAGVGGGLVLALAVPALAQEEITAPQVQVFLDNTFVMLAAVLVIFMQAGFALVEAGLTRAKSVANIMKIGR